MFDKETKQRDVVSVYVIVILNLKNDKISIKQLKIDVQEKWCLFMLLMVIY